MILPPAAAERLARAARDPAELRRTAGAFHEADLAAALETLGPRDAARIVAALPLELAARIFDEPVLAHPAAILERLGDGYAGPIVDAMSAGRRAALFRALPERERRRLAPALAPATRDAVARLLGFPPECAGAIMDTEFVGVLSSWTVEQALRHIRRSAPRVRLTCAIPVVEPGTHRLVRMVSVCELLVADGASPVSSIGEERPLVALPPLARREDAVRLLVHYRAAAVPVVDERGGVLGIIPVEHALAAAARAPLAPWHGGILGAPAIVLSLAALLLGAIAMYLVLVTRGATP
ncbi:MAG TPA: CBS domain-containing protein [Gemmatimonadaceae bacterium]|nr:CBS domain-containing protein [Gemmatimonadaceae bacterium]